MLTRHAEPGLARTARGSPLLVAGLLTLALALIGATWTLTLPYNGIADEGAHYVKALGVGGGDFAGTPAPPPSLDADQRLRFVGSNDRIFEVPPQLDGQDNSSCFVLKATRPASCLVVADRGPATQGSYVGSYPPLGYLAPGLAARLAGRATTGLAWGRLANGVSCALLWLVAGAAFLRGLKRRAWLIAGLLLAITPAAVSLAWSLNPNGLEAAGSVAFVALCLGATRPGSPRWMWWAMAPVGIVLAGSRPVAPVWVLFAGLVTVVVRGRPVLAAVRRAGPAAVVGLGGAALGGLATVAWDAAIGASAAPGHRDWLGYLAQTWHQLQGLQGGVISQVDWGEIGMTSWLRNPWELAVGSVVLIALLAGRIRDRIAVAAVLLAYFAACVLIVGITAPSGFPTGGRYVLGAAVTVPLVAAEIAQQRAARLGRAGLMLASAVVAVTHLAVLTASAHRYAVGINRPWSFLWSGSGWHPRGGWALPVLLAVLGALVITGSALLAGPKCAGNGTGQVSDAARRRELADAANRSTR